jgi:hypothetical protein
VDSVINSEDDGAVDVAEIRAQHRLTVPERSRVMVDAANRAIAVQEATGLMSFEEALAMRGSGWDSDLDELRESRFD